MRQHQPGNFSAQFPELAPVVIHSRGAVREHVFQRLGHPLRGAPVDGKDLIDLCQRHALIARDREFREAKQIGGFMERHLHPETGDRFCHPYASDWGC